MSPRDLILPTLRWLALVGMTFWLGGFTFYSAVVIPILHDAMGGIDSGMITGEVSNYLNAFGVATVVAWSVLAAFEHSTGERWARRMRSSLLGLSAAILVGLIALHPVMDRRLGSGEMSHFYPLHKIYLIASTFQWGINLAILAVSVWIWRTPPERMHILDQIWTDSPSP